jgi:hypothetical protein
MPSALAMAVTQALAVWPRDYSQIRQRLNVFTLPRQPTELDNGMLTASEVAVERRAKKRRCFSRKARPRVSSMRQGASANATAESGVLLPPDHHPRDRILGAATIISSSTASLGEFASRNSWGFGPTPQRLC